ncbi:MAG: hypothetical protein MRZ90_06470 [Candidatus Gastranaerophilales bacterium]|nr:hypothetical protein [Candidatus Gastranaerophilales bacterium]
MNNLISKAKNSITSTRNKFVDALLGKAQTYEQPQMQVGQGNAAFTDALMQDPDYIAINADIKNPNKQLKLDQIYQGLNHGSSSIAKLQQEYGVKTPQTKEEIELAKKLAFNSPSTITSGIANKPERTGGFLNNINKGYNENYNESFKPSNLELGENKGFGYRIGEAAGTLGRFANSSLGRGLMTAAIVGATGGSGLEALAYGGQAGLINQVAKKKDSLYRNELLNSYKQSIMNNDKYNKLDSAELKEIENYIKNDEAYIKASNEEEKNKIAANLRDELSRQKIIAKQNEAINNYTEQLAAQKGFINDDMYKNILNSQQLRDNAEYRNMILNNQQEQNKIMNQYRREQLAYQKQRAQVEDYYKRLGLNIQQSRLAADNYFRRQELAIKKNSPNGNFKDTMSLRKEFLGSASVKNATEIARQWNNVNSLYEQYKSGKIGKNSFDQALITTLNKVLDPTSVVRESEFDRTSAGQAMWDKLAGYQQKLIKGGSGLTDENRADLVNSLIIMKQANDKEVQKVAEYYSELAKRYRINPADIIPENYLTKSTHKSQNHGATQIGNFKVRVK